MKLPDIVRHLLNREWDLVQRSIRFFWQRRTRGWDDSDTWSLDWHIAKFTLPRLKRFREFEHCYPSCFNNRQEWNKVLDDMIYAFEYYEQGAWVGNRTKKDMRRIGRGLRNFGKYFGCLWW